MNRRQFVRTSLAVGSGWAAVPGTSWAACPTSGVDARSCGAVGDGSTDDTQALQRAADHQPGPLVLPPGSYRITKPIVIDLRKGYSGILGAAGTARVIMTGPGPAFQLIGDHQGTALPTTVEPHTWEFERFPILSGFEIVGRHEQADGLELQFTMKALVQGVLIRDCRYGIHLLKRNRNFILSHSHIYHGTDTGLFFDDLNLHQANIVGNHISYNARAGIRQLNGDVHNIQITGNDIEYNSGSEETTGEIVLEAPQGMASEYTIASNTIQARIENKGANILILAGPVDSRYNARLVAITGNVLGSREVDIDITGGQRIALSGNTIYGGSRLGVHLKGCAYVEMGSNTFASSTAGGFAPTGDGIHLEECEGCSLTGNILYAGGYEGQETNPCLALVRCRDVSVSACQVFDPHTYGIGLEGCHRCRISDNGIVDRREVRKMQAAIEIVDSHDMIVQNNAVQRGTAGDIICPPAAGRVESNTIWD